MSTAVAQAKLRDAVRELQFKWQRAREHWDDEAAAQFHNEVIQPIPSRVTSAITAMSRVGELMAAVHRECGDS